MKFKQGQKIIFIGDSITDDGRFQDLAGIGFGYLRLIHDYLSARYPELRLNIINKGISGNRVTDLAKRWEKDVIAEKPDWIAVSIGINDVWRQLDHDQSALEQVYPEEFEQVYRELLIKVQERTEARLIVMEPTIIEEDIYSEGNQKLKEYVKITQKLSKEFQAVHIPLHETFIHYIKENLGVTLTTDGVHMNPLGRMLMAVTFMEQIHGET